MNQYWFKSGNEYHCIATVQEGIQMIDTVTDMGWLEDGIIKFHQTPMQIGYQKTIAIMRVKYLK